MHKGSLWEKKLKKTEHLQDQDVDGKIMLKHILGNRVETWGNIPSGQGKEQILCYCETGSKTAGSVKRGEFLDQF